MFKIKDVHDKVNFCYVNFSFEELDGGYGCSIEDASVYTLHEAIKVRNFLFKMGFKRGALMLVSA